MVVRYLGSGFYKGTQADSKPTTASSGSVFLETDSRQTFYYSPGTGWIIEASGGGAAPGSAMVKGGTAAFSGNGINTSFPIQHGLTVVPDLASVEAASIDALGSYVLTKDSTYLTVVFQEPPPAGALNNVKFEWGASASSVSAAGIDNYTWLIYKQAGQYKARNGITGEVPTASISSTMSGAGGTWTYVRSNFNLAAEETDLTGAGSGAGGLIMFGRGVYTFTDEMLIDNTMTGGARAPAIQAQSKGGTILKFAPTAPLTSGIHVKTMVEPIIRDLDIWVDDTNVTTNIVHVDAMTGASAGGLFENIRIFKSLGSTINPYFPTPLPPVGQRGLYLQQGGNNLTNTMHFAQFRKIYIKDTETGIESVGIGNNSFMTFDGLYFWMNKQGFKGDSEFKQSHLTNLIYQAADGGNYGDYCVSLEGPANTVSGITSDVIGGVGSVVKPTAAVVILQPGAKYNRISNIASTGQSPDVINLSGSDTNTYDAGHYNSITAPSAQNRLGAFLGDSLTQGEGALQGGMTINQSAAGITDPENVDATTIIGKNLQLTTSATALQSIGITSNKSVARRRWNPCFTAKWKLNTGALTTIRFFIGLSESQTIEADDTMIPDGAACIGIGKDTQSTNYRMIRNDSTGAPTVTSITNTAGAAVACDTSPHQVWIYLDEARASAYISIDNHKANVISTAAEVPGTDDPLYLIAYVENVSGAAKVMNLSRMSIALMR